MHSQALIVGEGAVHHRFVFGDVAAGLVVHPQLYVFLLCVGCDAVDVEVGIGFHVVEMLIAAPVLPTFVPPLEEHALQVVGHSEVDIAEGIFSGGSVARAHHPGLSAEVHSPPDAYIFLRLDPRGVGYLTRLVEVQYQSGVDQIHCRTADLHRAPGGGELSGHVSLHAVGQRGEVGLQDAILIAAKHHLGVIVERGLMHRPVNGRLFSLHAEGEGGVGVFYTVDRLMAVLQFVCLKAAGDRPRLCCPVGKAKFGQFLRYRQRIGTRSGCIPLVAESGAVVEGAETHCQLVVFVAQRHCHLVVAVADALVFAPRLSPGLVEGAVSDAHLGIGSDTPLGGFYA